MTGKHVGEGLAEVMSRSVLEALTGSQNWLSTKDKIPICLRDRADYERGSDPKH